MTHIPPEIIEEVKNVANIVEIVGEYITLKKVGKNYVALCPFHEEDTPSFTVSEEKQIFHCFGCGIGGNVFTFLMRYKNCSFYEAVEEIANHYGIVISYKELGSEERAKYERKKQLLALHQRVAELYHQFLLKHPLAEKARNYLYKRGIKTETIIDYRLGYALPQWDTLTQTLKQQGIDLELAIESGLLIKNENGTIYDRFRDRIIFPIFNVKTEVIAFGGRVLDNSLPKYINSPETLIYKKGYNLYGCHVAKQWCQQEGAVLVVEGYFDLLSLYACNIKNVVATLGTALTPMQARFLRQLAPKVILVYDADTAGQKAAIRALPLLLKEGLIVEILILPAGDDPDSFVQREGTDAFLKYLHNTQNLLDWYLQQGEEETRHDLNARYQFLKEAMEIISLLKNPLTQLHYRDKICHLFGVNTKILSDLKKEKTILDLSLNEILPAFEKNVVKFLLNFPDYIPNFIEEGILTEFKHSDLYIILEKMIQAYERRGKIDVSSLISELDENLAHLLTHLSLTVEECESVESTAQGLLQQLKERHFKSLLKKIKEAEEKKDWQRLVSLLQEKNNLAYHLKRH